MQILRIVLLIWLGVLTACVLTMTYLKVKDYFDEKKKKGGKSETKE